MSASLPPDAPTRVTGALRQARAALERTGLLLLSDPALPSLVGIIVGEPLRTSWWGHPRGSVIYAVMNALEDDVDVLSTKLVAGKVTYVHRRLWSALHGVASAREAWQIDSLSPGARWLLDETDREGEVRTDLLALPPAARGARRVADLARDLERRLLVHATEVHTPSGAHAKVLQSWRRWAVSVQGLASLPVSEARQGLERAAEQLAADVEGGRVELPWRRSPPRPRAAHGAD